MIIWLPVSKVDDSMIKQQKTIIEYLLGVRPSALQEFISFHSQNNLM